MVQGEANRIIRDLQAINIFISTCRVRCVLSAQGTAWLLCEVHNCLVMAIINALIRHWCNRSCLGGAGAQPWLSPSPRAVFVAGEQQQCCSWDPAVLLGGQGLAQDGVLGCPGRVGQCPGWIQPPNPHPGCLGAPAQPGNPGMVPAPQRSQAGTNILTFVFRFTDLGPNEPERAIKSSLRANPELAAVRT